MLYGKLLKKLRRDRHVSQSLLALDITSQSALSRFEKGGEVYADILVAYLEKLNVHPVEFFMLAENKNFTNQVYIDKKIQDAIYSKNKRLEFVSESRLKYSKTGNIFYLINSLRVEVGYALINNLSLSDYSEDLSIIKKYLLSLDSWLLFEVTMYIDFMFIFDRIFIDTHHSRMVRSLNGLPFGQELSQNLSLLYGNNLIILGFERHDMEFIRKNIKYLEGIIDENPRNLIISIQLNLYKSMYQLNKKYTQILATQTTNDLKILKKYGYNKTYNDLISFFLKHVKKTGS